MYSCIRILSAPSCTAVLIGVSQLAQYFNWSTIHNRSSS